jgi:hypothetical protein
MQSLQHGYDEIIEARSVVTVVGKCAVSHEKAAVSDGTRGMPCGLHRWRAARTAKAR